MLREPCRSVPLGRGVLVLRLLGDRDGAHMSPAETDRPDVDTLAKTVRESLEDANPYGDHDPLCASTFDANRDRRAEACNCSVRRKKDALAALSDLAARARQAPDRADPDLLQAIAVQVERAEAAEADRDAAVREREQAREALRDAEVGFSDISVMLEGENDGFLERSYKRACAEWRAARVALAGEGTDA